MGLRKTIFVYEEQNVGDNEPFMVANETMKECVPVHGESRVVGEYQLVQKFNLSTAIVKKVIQENDTTKKS